MATVSPDLSRYIQQQIDRLPTADPRAWPVRVCREVLNALPLHGNQIYLWAVRPDGVVLCMDHESFSHAAEPEHDPLTLYAVLWHGARADHVLSEIVPPPPEGARQCEACGGTGSGEGQRPPMSGCLRCNALGWYVLSPRPIDEWLARIDRGDQLELRVPHSALALVAGRIAGFYACKGDEAPYWSGAGDAARRALGDRLLAWERGKPVLTEWTPNRTRSPDPFDSLEHAITFFGSGIGGTWEEEYALQPGGMVRITLTLNHDFDPAGPAFPRTEVREVDAEAARAAIGQEMRGRERRNLFPAVVPRGEGVERGPA